MDLIYIPEVLSYGSFRTHQYRDYDQPWSQGYCNYGTTTYDQHCRRQTQIRSSSSRTCDLCKENKKRSLASYIKQKTHSRVCTKICEEEGEVDENETDNCKSTSGQESTPKKEEKNLQKRD